MPYDMPVLTDENIWNSTLYKFCRALPKGADLHIHGLALLPFDEFLSFVLSRDDLYIGISQRNRCYLFLHETKDDVTEDECLVRDALEQGLISREELQRQWTVLGGADAEDIWTWFETLFDKQLALGETPDLLESYYREAFRYYCRSNILHLEIRQLFFGTPEEAQANAEAIRKAYYDVREEYPDLIVSLVGTGLKYTWLNMDMTDMLLDNAVYVHEHVMDESDPDHPHRFLIGIDLVNEEDNSHPLSVYEKKLNGIVEANPELHLILHAGESLYAYSDNVIDAYLLGADRIGHGTNLYRFPSLMERIREAGTCLEICPISNQTLRYVTDLRIHPAMECLKRGLPVCLSSDDPAYQEHATLTDDFFAAIVCWDLGLAEIKQLCMNSITYASVDDIQKEELMHSWEKQWNAFLSFGT